MALISNAKGRSEKQSPSGYVRLFGIKELGNLTSRTHAASITAGTELEKLIWERVRQIENLDDFIANTLHEKIEGVWVARKDQIKKSNTIHSQKDRISFVRKKLYKGAHMV